MFEQIENTVNSLKSLQKTIETRLDLSAIDTLIVIFSQMLGQDDETLQLLDAQERQTLVKEITHSGFEQLNGQDKRQVLQFLIVGTMLRDELQANYQITPDSIGMWVGFFIQELVQKSKQQHLLDIGIGSGNLVATIQQVLENETTQIVGVDNDDTLITLASGMSALLDQKWQLKYEDVVTATDVHDFDIVVGDLPVGFYPQSVSSDDFQVAVASGTLTYSHHLMIEKAIKSLKPGGWTFLLVPTNLFESDQASELLKWLQTDNVWFQAFIQFADKLFANTSSQKALLVLQKPGALGQQAHPALLAKVPELTDRSGNARFITEFKSWAQTNQQSQ
ncbi:class I SAM-dependent methyltransferase [Weissella diestrammenae]|uniref:Class I SAM-dependent methyltransferase n=1 Tax=Weissella diestrammenae TaxID=1162633 RepID=A0A7G9T502_9LACO|nr:class I SAM-dependent methyltransferase [Weissella diestrammenae]MCM0582899.1 class I SAM-dependent methyltransferase [Weissella diestrammenae]QNN75177.1 class I SAM-dependent methyltransferase [Weissella diestrammenae]